MRKLTSAAWLAASLITSGSALAPHAVAQDPAPLLPPSGTNLRSTDGSATLASVLSFACDYVREGQTRRINYDRVTCHFATTAIGRPNAEQVAQRLLALETPDPQKENQEALRHQITEVWAKTCQAFNYGVREYSFEKVDDTTWRSMDGAATSGTATIRTIWSKRDANGFISWSYKQVTSGDPACIPVPFGECAKDSSNEWTRDAAITLTGCQFFN